MAATASELRRIYSYVLGDTIIPSDCPRCRARSRGPTSRPDLAHGRRPALASANGGVNPELTFTQLECLKVVLSQDDFAPIVPTIRAADSAPTPLVELYKRCSRSRTSGHLRALQRAVFEYDKLGPSRSDARC